MSNSVRPHRQQPTRLPRPWDSPGKNTGVGCHFLLQCMKVKSENEVAQLCLTLPLHDPMDCSPPGSSVHGIFQARVLEWGAIAFSTSSSGNPIIRMLVCLIWSQRFLRLSSGLFILFTLFCSSEVISIILSSNSLILSASDILLLINFSNCVVCLCMFIL